jgi:hypothetical protein
MNTQVKKETEHFFSPADAVALFSQKKLVYNTMKSQNHP